MDTSTNNEDIKQVTVTIIRSIESVDGDISEAVVRFKVTPSEPDISVMAAMSYNGETHQMDDDTILEVLPLLKSEISMLILGVCASTGDAGAESGVVISDDEGGKVFVPEPQRIFTLD